MGLFIYLIGINAWAFVDSDSVCLIAWYTACDAGVLAYGKLDV